MAVLNFLSGSIYIVRSRDKGDTRDDTFQVVVCSALEPISSLVSFTFGQAAAKLGDPWIFNF